MILVIPTSWLLFAVTDLNQMVVYLKRLFPFLTPSGTFTYFAGDYLKYGTLYALSLVMGLIFMTGFPMKLYKKHEYNIVTALLLLLVFWASVYCMKIGMDDPFLYFRF